MKRLLAIIISLLIFPILLAPSAMAKTPDQDMKVVTLNSNEVVDGDYFAVGDTVNIYGTVNGDVYVAAGIVNVDGEINGDLLGVGGQVTIYGKVSQNIRLAGGEIKLGADVGRNTTLAGGNVDILATANLNGSLVLAAGNSNVASPVANDLVAGAGTLILSNNVGGNVKTGVGMLTVSPDAIVGGNVEYWSDEDAVISDSASISGTVKKNTPPKTDFDKQSIRKSFDYTAKFISFASVLLIGLIMLKLFPKYMQSVNEMITKFTARSFGIGLITLIVAPIALIMFMITIVGVPVSLILFAFYFIFVYLAKVFVSYWVGNYVLNKAKVKKYTPYLSFTLGLIIYYVIGSIPVVGGFVKLTSLLLGLGASVINCKKLYTKSLSK